MVRFAASSTPIIEVVCCLIYLFNSFWKVRWTNRLRIKCWQNRLPAAQRQYPWQKLIHFTRSDNSSLITGSQKALLSAVSRIITMSAYLNLEKSFVIVSYRQQCPAFSGLSVELVNCLSNPYVCWHSYH